MKTLPNSYKRYTAQGWFTIAAHLANPSKPNLSAFIYAKDEKSAIDLARADFNEQQEHHEDIEDCAIIEIAEFIPSPRVSQ